MSYFSPRLYYINLSNGALALTNCSDLVGSPSVRFIRIQSTALEQKHWVRVIEDLDTDFLVSIAQGCEIHLWDYGVRRGIPRAFWQGVPWIIYCIKRSWFRVSHDVHLLDKNRTNVSTLFCGLYELHEDAIRSKLDWYKRWLDRRVEPDSIQFQLHYDYTEDDGKYDLLKLCLRGHFTTMRNGQGARFTGTERRNPSTVDGENYGNCF
jgi:hypothetical protein